ncbi:AAA family ATPase [Virgibacillus pantothenticus]|uniref:ATP-dependent nuclease n=1 Tax=Virgibacillus pantothenticus TaxID=1473 RepID=UPI001C21A101|nr:AAA family ATPase [Virgibacillus pantothenticus]MBU8567910.1 AAA family ATPase [Virgibacillus pantothenticus]MBU8601830.1 AAA family ATPase [Virgibacillus pantothenticus]MBU8635984.1 AAA family ATPase [Virgibacillus pantothenticus]MBU8643668.1 AAA family ATPase [Virgibacillus pantothenticus]MBU8647808.1 AAA family ATPase [Virgibacillus pantothenticus]
MYISNVDIKNYKNFRSNTIEFNDGINVIIGHNNAGKSNLLRAMALIFNPSAKKNLTIDDFNKTIALEELKLKPPSVKVSITLSQEVEEDLMGDDLVVVSHWLTKLEEPYEAKLHYEFCLPIKHHEDYERILSTVTSEVEAWEIIDRNFLRLYTYKIYGGNLENQIAVDGEYLKKFDFQFLDAIRDVERDMFSGKNTLLKNVLDFFMDFDIKSNEDIDDDDKERQIKDKKIEFEEQARDLMDLLNERMSEGKQQILSYSKDIGASFDNAEPNFAGSITDIELYSALKLIVEYQTGIQLPITHNGLGYNNLIFMSLLLAKMQVNASETYLGNNAKVFPMLVIEEPEAHLHPSMQRQLLKFLKQNLEDKKVRQIFVTTHSTHITGALSLDELICLYRADNETQVSYPGKVFGTNEESKKYVQRFLDATKSNMLFAEKIILVEGLAEQLLMSIFAEYVGKSLEDYHVAVINVGGKYFDHFLNLFNTNNSLAINRKVVCITDRDPVRKEVSSKGASYKKCYPFEMNIEPKKYQYKINKQELEYSRNIKFYSQDEMQGKTLEYDLAHFNPTLEELVTDSMSNKEEIKGLMKLFKEGKEIDELFSQLSNSKENTRIIGALKHDDLSWTVDDKKIALIAARYLNSVGKGVNALELAYVLQENLAKRGKETYIDFIVPDYIKDAIEWVCEN